MLFDDPYLSDEELRQRILAKAIEGTTTANIPGVGVDQPSWRDEFYKNPPWPQQSSQPQEQPQLNIPLPPLTQTAFAPPPAANEPTAIPQGFRTSGNAIVHDGFDGAGNLLGPMPSGIGIYNKFAALPVLDNYVSRDPVHILGVQGRYGSSMPTVDYSGPIARAHAADLAMRMMQMWSHEDMSAADNAAKANVLNANLGNKTEQVKNRALMLTSNAKVPVAMAQAEVDDMVKNKQLTPEEASAMMLERHLSTPDAHGLLTPIGIDKKTGSFAEVVKRIPADADPDMVKKFLMENRQVTREQVVKRYNELLTAGKPWLRRWNITGSNGPDTFDPKNLSPEEKAEFDAITKIFGAK